LKGGQQKKVGNGKNLTSRIRRTPRHKHIDVVPHPTPKKKRDASSSTSDECESKERNQTLWGMRVTHSSVQEVETKQTVPATNPGKVFR